MFCSSCGKKAKPGSKFCPSCGKQPKKTPFKKYLIIILAFSAIIAVLTFVTQALIKQKNKQKQETQTTEATAAAKVETEEPKPEEVRKLFAKTELPDVRNRFKPTKEIELLHYDEAKQEVSLKATDTIFLAFHFIIDDWRETVPRLFVSYEFYSPSQHKTYKVSYHKSGTINFEEKELDYRKKIKEPGLDFPPEFTAQEATIMAAAAMQLVVPEKEIKKISGFRDYKYQYWKITLHPTEGTSLDYFPFQVTETSVNFTPRPRYEPKNKD